MKLNDITAATKFLQRKIVDTPFLDLGSSKIKTLFPEKTKVKMKTKTKVRGGTKPPPPHCTFACPVSFLF